MIRIHRQSKGAAVGKYEKKQCKEKRKKGKKGKKRKEEKNPDIANRACIQLESIRTFNFISVKSD